MPKSGDICHKSVTNMIQSITKFHNNLSMNITIFFDHAFYNIF